MEMKVNNTSANNNEAVSLLMGDDEEKNEGDISFTIVFLCKILHQAY